jgi:hypothetical protein
MTLVLLSPSKISYVCTDSCIDDDVLFARMSIYTQTTQDKKASSKVKFLRLLSQKSTGVGQWEGFSVDVSKR